jgi:hypothetical protein
MDSNGIQKFEVLADVPLESRLTPYTSLPVSTFVASPTSPERWGQDDSIHMLVRKDALLVMFVWCSEIMPFNYRRFRTWMTGSTAVAGGAERQPCIKNNASPHPTYSTSDEGLFRTMVPELYVHRTGSATSNRPGSYRLNYHSYVNRPIPHATAHSTVLRLSSCSSGLISPKNASTPVLSPLYISIDFFFLDSVTRTRDLQPPVPENLASSIADESPYRKSSVANWDNPNSYRTSFGYAGHSAFSPSASSETFPVFMSRCKIGTQCFERSSE